MLNNLNVDLKNVPPELKQEGSDWFAIFTPIATSGEGTRKPSMEVELVHTLLHDRCVSPGERGLNQHIIADPPFAVNQRSLLCAIFCRWPVSSDGLQ